MFSRKQVLSHFFTIYLIAHPHMKLSSFFKRVPKNILKLHSKKKALVFSITLAGFFIIGTAILINQKAPSSAELRFSEFSKNKDIKGSVIPASCESFPTVGYNHGTHAVPDGGHCGNCPANTRLTNVPYYYCNDGVNPYEWYPNGCFAPNTNDFYVGAYHLVYPLCQWQVNPACPSVYIDQACPATVNISISPSTISYGANSSMSYSSTNASACTFYNIRNFALWDAWDLNSWAAGAAPGAYNWDSSWGPHYASQAYLIQCANADNIVASAQAILTVCPQATPIWNGSACVAPAPAVNINFQ